MHPLVELARRSIETYVLSGKIIAVPCDLAPELKRKAGTFVSLHDSRGRLRGCIGTIEPCEENIAAETIHNAISAATRDPRFPPVSPSELEDLEIEVSVLNPPEPISGLDELDPKRYGVIVVSGHRRGLLLPDLEGVDTPEFQVEIASEKACIRAGAPRQLYRFSVTRHK